LFNKNREHKIINMKSGINKSGAGFTLIEIILVIAILGVLGTFVGGVLLQSYRSSLTTTNLNEIRQNGNFVMRVIEADIRNAKEIDQGSGCGIPPPSPPDPNKLVLKDSTGALVTFDRGTTPAPAFVYKNTTTSHLTSNKVNVTTLSFTCEVGTFPQKVSISLTLSDYPGGTLTLPFVSTVALRNYSVP